MEQVVLIELTDERQVTWERMTGVQVLGVRVLRRARIVLLAA